MKVTLINTTDAGGGAPAACMRLLKALRLNGVDASLLVSEKKTREPNVSSIGHGTWMRLKKQVDFLLERVPFILLKAKDKSLRFAFSTAKYGTDVSELPIVVNTDIIHLHWTNRSFLSIDDLKQLLAAGKPVVWTLHDMWAFTGGCHYAGECDHFISQCGNCWMLKGGNAHDISFEGWMHKNNLLRNAKNIVFVPCSNWLAGVAKTSSLLRDFSIRAIPNPIDTDLFSPKSISVAREKWIVNPQAKVILFGAANILDRRKGIGYLVDALNELKKNYTGEAEVEILIFGKNKAFDIGLLPFKTREIGLISSQEDLAELYSLADVYVSPAIEDNLPNTVMEALACGTPVVAFNTGGIPDMVEHLKNGYLAQFKSATDFADGINYILTTQNIKDLQVSARCKVMENFTNAIVAEQYKAVYQSVLSV